MSDLGVSPKDLVLIERMTMTYHFPFGSPLRAVEQQDRSPKDVFVLGVYASAVHAKWLGADGKTLVKALAVASEPTIFWDGSDAASIIDQIKLPPGAGSLHPAASTLNGPSGKALDERFLQPLGYSRSSAWLCDLLPESRMNHRQAEAITRVYEPMALRFGLPKATIPVFRKGESGTAERRDQILDELVTSNAKRIVVLGDIPIQQFIEPLTEGKVRNLQHLTDHADGYGKPWRTILAGRPMEVIGLCHPRQAARLGSSSAKWGAAHDAWLATQRRTTDAS